ncbi:hypothetical protein [Pelosinus sp. IPA-1]|uniref:hypothetical protein n=1 Tax=Pelosinus sp. IPA-1 TaxID=3029569 RepID=UPI00243620E7|nr:hypothetical protein [Pelosinus sp. IPA-1]GMB00090.1 hypothetical protein PIPA1_28890 [Pelosinus sp. IPA-1]
MLLKDISKKAREYGWIIPVEITEKAFQEVVVGRVPVPEEIEERLSLILYLATKAVKKVGGRRRFVRFRRRAGAIWLEGYDMFIALTPEKSVIIAQIKEAKDLKELMANDGAK